MSQGASSTCSRSVITRCKTWKVCTCITCKRDAAHPRGHVHKNFATYRQMHFLCDRASLDCEACIQKPRQWHSSLRLLSGHRNPPESCQVGPSDAVAYLFSARKGLLAVTLLTLSYHRLCQSSLQLHYCLIWTASKQASICVLLTPEVQQPEQVHNRAHRDSAAAVWCNLHHLSV